MENIYELNKPLKAILFNHTEFENTTLTPRSVEPGQRFMECLRNDLQITDIDIELNATKAKVINALMKRNFVHRIQV